MRRTSALERTQLLKIVGQDALPQTTKRLSPGFGLRVSLRRWSRASLPSEAYSREGCRCGLTPAVLSRCEQCATDSSPPPRSGGAGTSQGLGGRRMPVPTSVPWRRAQRRSRRSKLPVGAGSQATTSGAVDPSSLLPTLRSTGVWHLLLRHEVHSPRTSAFATAEARAAREPPEPPIAGVDHSRGKRCSGKAPD
jgi:hypothetical protein